MVLRASIVAAAATLLAACGSPGAKPSAPASADRGSSAKATFEPVTVVRPSQLLPDLDATAIHRGVDPDGTRRFLTMRMRVLERPDGSIRKAPGLLPGGRTSLQSLEMPSRLGGGYLFFGTTSSRTQLWRAKDWLAPLEPLVRLNKRYDQVVAGFDRLYLVSDRANTHTVAIDPENGAFLPLGKLPPPAGQGPMVFADAWRAVAVADFRGPLATFDAGTTWVPLGIDEPVRRLDLDRGALVIRTKSSDYALDAEGNVALHTDESDESNGHVADTPVGPLGRRPLRAAIARGVPVDPTRALVAHDGHLVEVSTQDGAVVRTVRDAYPRSFGECQGIRLGRGVGFVCGVHNGPTEVFAFEPPQSLRSVLTYPEPRAVVSSGNGAIVVRAPCPGADAVDGHTQYCVRDLRGNLREIRFQGDLGAERVVALADGRIVIVIAPRPGAEARLVVLDGDKAVTRALSFKALSRRQRAVARRGLWMHGAIEVKPGIVGLWVEAGGPVLGLHVGLDGKVQAGTLQPTPGVILLSGRFGLVWRHGGEGLETTDGGLTWKEFELPAGRPGRAKTTRGCSAVGCAVEGWLRVGWGDPADEQALQDAPESKVVYPPYRRSDALRFVCAPTGKASPPPAPMPKPKPSRVSARPPHVPRYRRPRPVAARYEHRGWIPFGPVPAPTLAPDQVGTAGGRDYGELFFRAYVWGPKASDWSRAGKWLVRFDDPYDPSGTPVSSAPSSPPWSDLTSAAIHVNSVRTAVSDPAGRDALLGWCPAPNQCQLFAISNNQAPLEISFQGSPLLPVVSSAVRTPEGWFLLGNASNLSSTVYAVDAAGNARELRTYPRVQQHRYDRVQLVRRASGSGVAIWLTSATGEGETEWFALPLDTTTGEIEGVQPMGSADLGGVVPEPCTPGHDGWLLETALPVSPHLRLPDGASFGGSERVRLRLTGDRACIEGMAARAREAAIGFGRHHAWAAGNRSRRIPLTVWDTGTRRKYELACEAREQREPPDRR